MVRMISRIRDALGVEVPPEVFFATPTIRGLSRTVAELPANAAAPGEVAALLDLVEGLSSHEIEGLLHPMGTAPGQEGHEGRAEGAGGGRPHRPGRAGDQRSSRSARAPSPASCTTARDSAGERLRGGGRRPAPREPARVQGGDPCAGQTARGGRLLRRRRREGGLRRGAGRAWSPSVGGALRALAGGVYRGGEPQRAPAPHERRRPLQRLRPHFLPGRGGPGALGWARRYVGSIPR